MNKELTLRDDGVEMITYEPQLKTTVADVARAWKEFCELPTAYKSSFAMADTQSGVGYEMKDGSGPRGDQKENFDYSKIDDELDVALETHPNDTARRFVELIRRLDIYVQSMIQTLGKRTGIPTENATPFFRCLHYPGGTSVGDTIAAPHTDHSGFTFHLYETTEGCERLTFDRKWVSLPVSQGQAVTFGGMQSQLVTSGEIKAMCHRVRANTESSMKGRLAIVCFVSLSHAPKYNKKKYGRLQEMEPGFNYTMPSEEFKSLFS